MLARWTLVAAATLAGALATSGALPTAADGATVQLPRRTVTEGTDRIVVFDLNLTCPPVSPGNVRYCQATQAGVTDGSALHGRDYVSSSPNFFVAGPATPSYPAGQDLVPNDTDSQQFRSEHQYQWGASDTAHIGLPQAIEIPSDPYPVPGPDESFAIYVTVANILNHQVTPITTYVQPVVIHHRFTITRIVVARNPFYRPCPQGSVPGTLKGHCVRVANPRLYRILKGYERERLTGRQLAAKGFVKRNGYWVKETLVVSSHKRTATIRIGTTVPTGQPPAPPAPQPNPPPQQGQTVVGEQSLVPSMANADQTGQNIPVFQGDAGGGYVLSSPRTGTITSWSFLSGGIATGKRFELAVLAPVDASGTNWRLVATSAPAAVTTATGTDAVNGPFAVQIPINVGDRIALMPVDDSSTPIETGTKNVDGIRYFAAPFTGLGSSQPLAPGSTADNGQIVPIQATVTYTGPPGS